MSYFHSIIKALSTLALAIATALGSWWLVTSKSEAIPTEKSKPSATVHHVVKESDLNVVTLTGEAEKRIGLVVSTCEKSSVPRVRIYGGEVTVPAGKTILVAAPLTGILKLPANGDVKIGQSVKRGQTIFQLTPLLTPDGRATLSASLADTEGQVSTAKTQVELTTIALERAKKVLNQGAGSQRQVDEAEAAYDLAAKTLEAAKARLAILNNVVGDADAGTSTPIAIESPEKGIIRAISALPGQTVPSGAALFEVIDVSTVWIRVPLPVGDLENIDASATVQVSPLAASSGPNYWSAKPVKAPPSANPVAATVDVFYEVPNPKRKLVPGQRLGVTIPLGNSQENLTVPWTAIVIDTHGGTWVYEQVEPHQFARRRVFVGYSSGTNAVLRSGPPPGKKVVVAGAQELFGAETGFVK